jgi:hypothetical protein
VRGEEDEVEECGDGKIEPFTTEDTEITEEIGISRATVSKRK